MRADLRTKKARAGSLQRMVGRRGLAKEIPPPPDLLDKLARCIETNRLQREELETLRDTLPSSASEEVWRMIHGGLFS
jgi:hypothetical protein